MFFFCFFYREKNGSLWREFILFEFLVESQSANFGLGVWVSHSEGA